MRKYTRKEPTQIRIDGTRAYRYRICWPDTPPKSLPERLGMGWTAELEMGSLGQLVPADGRRKRRRPVDTRKALAGLLALETDFLLWRVRREALWAALTAEHNAKHGIDDHLVVDASRPAIRALGIQNRKYRDRFARQLEAWADRCGSLGLPDKHGVEWVDMIMLRTMMIREWVALPGVDTGVRRGHATFPTPMVGAAGKNINRDAGLCTRYSANSEWEAPTLWSALCFDLRRYDELGWKFSVCEARDCGNLLLQTRTDKVMCSERCGKRERDHEKRDQRSQ
jgi:hypothetical protein